jgi:hypothetical protein
MRAHMPKDNAARAAEAVRGGGKPLPSHVQRRAAGHYGFGFEHVRVHDDPAANTAARSLHAAAYTLGGDIAFAPGRYDPSSAAGGALLQHELRHVAQQRWAGAAQRPQLDAGDSPHEREARTPFAGPVSPMPEQRIQCAPEEEQYSLGTGTVDIVGRAATSDTSWPFIKAVLEGFIGGLKTGAKDGRADEAKDHLSGLMRPWNFAKFYGGYLVGVVIGLVSPITDLVKGVIGLVKLAFSGVTWLAKWSPVGVAISPERQARLAALGERLGDLGVEIGKSLLDFLTDPKAAAQMFKGFLEDLMGLAVGKGRSIGGSAAGELFKFLKSDYYEMGKGIGEVIGTLIAQVLMLVFSEAIGNLITKGASLLGKAAEFVAGKAVQAFAWIKGVFSEALAVLRKAVQGGLKLFRGVIDKVIKAFDAVVAVFSESGALADLAGERVAAGVRRGAPEALSNVMESRMVVTGRTTPTTVADLRTPKVHPSNVPKKAAVVEAPPVKPAELPKAPTGSAAEARSMERGEGILTEFSERQQGARPEVLADQLRKSPPSVSRHQANVGLAEDHHIASVYQANQQYFRQAGLSRNVEENMLREFAEHGQQRGWYRWYEKGKAGEDIKAFKRVEDIKYTMRGHHPDYNNWVTNTLKRAITADLPQEEARRRLLGITGRIRELLKVHPDILTYGPYYLPEAVWNISH